MQIQIAHYAINQSHKIDCVKHLNDKLNRICATLKLTNIFLKIAILLEAFTLLSFCTRLQLHLLLMMTITISNELYWSEVSHKANNTLKLMKKDFTSDI